MGNRTKINWLLILQGWAMLWVVIGHAPLGAIGEGPKLEISLYKFAYSFHMPLFILVSGYLFHLTRLNNIQYKCSYKKIIKDKLLRLMLPGFVFSIIATVLKIVFSSEMSRPIVISFEEIVHGYLYPYDNPMRELWFIVTLLWLFLLAPIWELTLKNRLSMWGTFIVLVIIHFFHPPIGFLCVDRVFNHAVWFLLGIIISKENIVTALLENNASLITICVGVIVYAIGNYTSPFITTIGCIIFSFGLALWADKYVPKLFCGFRNYTYQIFLMGIFFQIFVKILYRYISMPYIVAYILCILMGLYVPVLVSKIVKIIKWKPLSLCVGLK